jgi:hypothetical protein
VTAPDPGHVLRRALIGWGLGHVALERRASGWLLLATEGGALGVLAWLTLGLADSSAYLVPFLAGMAFIAAWAWQAVAAYGLARRSASERQPAPARSPAAAIGLLGLPLLVWGTGFWLIGARSATPAAVLDRFVTAWTDDALGAEWPAAVRREAASAAASLGTGPDRFRNLRVRIPAAPTGELGRGSVIAQVDAIHFDRQPSRFLGLFPGSELIPVADDTVLMLELRPVPVALPGGGDVGAVRWTLTRAEAP